MAFHESIYPGGERGFALDMMYDSLIYRNEITWYSVMISKKTNLIALQKDLKTSDYLEDLLGQLNLTKAR